MNPASTHCYHSKVALCLAWGLAFLGIASLMMALFGGRSLSNWFVGDVVLTAKTGFIPILILAFASPVFLIAALVVNRLGRSNRAKKHDVGQNEKSDAAANFTVPE